MAKLAMRVRQGVRRVGTIGERQEVREAKYRGGLETRRKIPCSEEAPCFLDELLKFY